MVFSRSLQCHKMHRHQPKWQRCMIKNHTHRKFQVILKVVRLIFKIAIKFLTKLIRFKEYHSHQRLNMKEHKQRILMCRYQLLIDALICIHKQSQKNHKRRKTLINRLFSKVLKKLLYQRKWISSVKQIRLRYRGTKLVIILFQSPKYLNHSPLNRKK